MNFNQEPAEQVADVTPLVRPKLFFETITFSDGSCLSLDHDDIVVFVGPNNAGKSAALRELEVAVGRKVPSLVIKDTTMRREGKSEDLKIYLESKAQRVGENGEYRFGGIGFDIHHSHIHYFDTDNNRQTVAFFFARRLTTESRLQDSNPAPAIALFHAPPTHPVHTLLMDPSLADDISNKFRHAFGKDLTPFRAGGSSYPLYVGKKPDVPIGKDELSKEFVESLIATNVTLHTQGDGMRSFAAVILNILATQTHSTQFLDEPEAFLHPPQARLLGRYIAENRNQSSQLFIATHSTDILDGLIEGGSDKVRIVRIRREGDINYIKELSKEETKSVAKDTLARFSGVFDGIFFEHVVICESDSDCMLYESVLNLQSISGDRKPDVLFIHTAGKHRMAKLAETLRSLDVPVSVIADIDILNDKGTFKNLFEKLGGVWDELEKNWKSINDALTKQRPPLGADHIANLIKSELEGISELKEFPVDKEPKIKDIFKSVAPWAALKRSGRSALPSGEAIKHFDDLYERCSERGLWIVPVGEVEGFCRTIGGHGPGFVEKVLETRDLATDPELEEVRTFVMKIWAKASKAKAQVRS